MKINKVNPSFQGLRIEKEIKKVEKAGINIGKNIYESSKSGDFINFAKIGYDNLIVKPFNMLKASLAEITAYRFSLSLAEAYAEGGQRATRWVQRFNPDNVSAPLAVNKTINSEKIKENVFAKNLKVLLNFFTNSKKLDIPITDSKGNIILPTTIFDLETTGLSSSKDKILQIGLLENVGTKVLKSFNQLINPKSHIPSESTAVHGITDKMVANAPTLPKIFPQLQKQFQESNLVAYNAQFDVAFINKFIREQNLLHHKNVKEINSSFVLDPYILLQRIHPFVGAKKKLSYQYQWLFCKPLENAHDAYADVKGTKDILNYCLLYLSKHRKDKSVPLTLREVLIFQNGGQNIENINIEIDKLTNFRKDKSFMKSYILAPLEVTNYFSGFRLSKTALKTLTNEIGENNVNKLLSSGYLDTIVSKANTESKETQSKSMRYLLEENYKKVLETAKLEPFNNKSSEDIINIIINNSRHYLKNKTKLLWVKNIDMSDKANDLPDIEIARKVLRS